MTETTAQDVSRRGAAFRTLRYICLGLKRFHEFLEAGDAPDTRRTSINHEEFLICLR
jgi:hypothetical protein